MDPAVRLILGGFGGGVTDQQVRDFLQFAQDRGIDLSLLHVAEQGGRLILAAVPVLSPGRTMLMFASPPPSGSYEPTLAKLIDVVCRAAAGRDVQLAQVLLDPTDLISQRVYKAAQFQVMAELLYLQGTPRAGASFPILPANFSLATYSPATHDQFVEAIQASYEQSLDCPGLNGVRAMADVIDGHKATGQFDPRHWYLLQEFGRPVGVLLLASSGGEGQTMELVYLGLSPATRGRQLGDLLLRLALAVTAETKHDRLTLAVDSQNAPALKIYYRAGMSRLTSKVALMRRVELTV